MPLMVSNTGDSDITLAAGAPIVGVPSGKSRNISGYMINNTSAQWDALENQRQTNRKLLYSWVGLVDFPTGSLQMSTFLQDEAIASVAIGLVKTATNDTVQSLTVEFTGEPHTGNPISIPVFGIDRDGLDVHVPYDIEIIDTKLRLGRGCNGAEAYLCLNQDGNDPPLSDKYDLSSGDVKTESSTVSRRLVPADSDLLVFCSNDYFQGIFQVFFRRQSLI